MTPVWMTLCARADSPATPSQCPVCAARMHEGHRDTHWLFDAQHDSSAIKGPRLSAQHHPAPNVTITLQKDIHFSSPQAPRLSTQRPLSLGLSTEKKTGFSPPQGPEAVRPALAGANDWLVSGRGSLQAADQELGCIGAEAGLVPVAHVSKVLQLAARSVLCWPMRSGLPKVITCQECPLLGLVYLLSALFVCTCCISGCWEVPCGT